MYSHNAKLTAAPVTIGLAGQNYQMTPLADQDYQEFENWLRERPVRIAMDHCHRISGLTTAEKEILMKQAMEISSRISMGSAEGLQVMATLEGAAYLTWLGTRRNHPELTPEKIRAAFTDPRSLEEAMSRINHVNNLDGLPVKKKRGPRQTTHQKKARAKNRRKTFQQIKAAASNAASTLLSPSTSDGDPK